MMREGPGESALVDKALSWKVDHRLERLSSAPITEREELCPTAPTVAANFKPHKPENPSVRTAA